MLARSASQLLAAVFFSATIFFTGCTGGPPITGDGLSAQSTRQIAPYSQLTVDLAQAEVFVVQGERSQITLVGEQALIERIRLRAKDQRLIVDTPYRLNPQIPLQVRLQTPDLQQLVVQGNSRVRLISGLSTEFIDIDISGTSTLDINLQAQKLRLRAAGTSYSLWEGKVAEAEVNLIGAAVASASAMPIDTAQVTLSGTSQAQLHVNTSLDANTSDSSQLQLSGSAKIKHYTSSGESSLSLQR